jgi:hypothetical protein
MRVSGGKMILAVACLLLSFVLYSVYLVASVVVAGIAEFGQFLGIAIAYLLVAIAFLWVMIGFMLNSPLDFLRILLQFLAFIGVWPEIARLIESLMS